MNEQYRFVEIPIERHPRHLGAKERKSYFVWFVNVIPERVEQLRDVVNRTPGFEAWRPEGTADSLVPLGTWFESQVETRPHSDEELVELRTQVEKIMPGVELPERTLTHRTTSLVFDVGIYLGLVLVKNVEGARWHQAAGGKMAAEYGQPVIAGLPLGECNPVRLVRVLASAISDESQRGSRLRELYDIWSGAKMVTIPDFGAPKKAPGA